MGTSERVRIEPGAEAPISVAWRIEEGRQPERLDYGEGTLALP